MMNNKNYPWKLTKSHIIIPIATILTFGFIEGFTTLSFDYVVLISPVFIGISLIMLIRKLSLSLRFTLMLISFIGYLYVLSLQKGYLVAAITSLLVLLPIPSYLLFIGAGFPRFMALARYYKIIAIALVTFAPVIFIFMTLIQ